MTAVQEEASGMPSRILIVEDVGIQVRLTQLCLERAGYQVLAARDGASALAIILEQRPDLVLLDVDLPVMNGFQVLDAIRRNSDVSGIPVIMLTAHAKDSPLFAEWASKRDAFMTKPFSPSALLERVQEVLRTVSSSVDH